MVGSGRSPGSQHKHDNEVKKVAKDYAGRGYDVEADISGYKRPPTVGGYRPDVRAKKGKYETLVEVETPDTVDTVHALSQELAFRKSARRSPNRHFKKKIAD